jgi:GDP-L-fucose synthase
VKLYIAGINGMVGSAVAKLARSQSIEVEGKSSRELDLTERFLVYKELKNIRPDVLVISAAKVGGIKQNVTFPVDFLSENLQIQTNLLDAAHEAGVKRVLFLGSSCIYPKFAQQPIKEEFLLSGPLEPTNAAYAIAKIAGIKLVESYRKQYKHSWISIMPTNLYGPGDNFDSESAHVLPALINKFHKAKVENHPKVSLWGDGSALREFLYVDDLAEAILLLLAQYDCSAPINVGSGQEISIRDLAAVVSATVGYSGGIEFGENTLNGTPRKLLDSSKIASLGWIPKTSLTRGVEQTYSWFVKQNTESRVN